MKIRLLSSFLSTLGICEERDGFRNKPLWKILNKTPLFFPNWTWIQRDKKPMHGMLASFCNFLCTKGTSRKTLVCCMKSLLFDLKTSPRPIRIITWCNIWLLGSILPSVVRASWCLHTSFLGKEKMWKTTLWHDSFHCKCFDFEKSYHKPRRSTNPQLIGALFLVELLHTQRVEFPKVHNTIQIDNNVMWEWQ